MEKISVITPSYNSEKTIEECIRSVIAQNYRNLEHIVIDDCSSDDSLLIIEKLASSYPHLRIVRNLKNRGPAEARNRGLELAKGNLICFLDSDDVWLKNKLATQVEIAKLKKYPLICGGYFKFKGDDDSFSIIHKKLIEISFNKMKYSNWIYTSSVMVDKRLTGEFKMDQDLYYDDYGCWLVIIRKFGPAYYLPREVFKYRITTKSVSRNKLTSAVKTMQVYEKVFKFNLLQKIFYFTFYVLNGIKKSV
ncbi:glycosyltransferase [Akkermansiaceae bacterium]|nr:glycosyltransferase [Akkermansiaceae bacterium]MDB4633277.1 glycosyltransferase [Akkermansiaceae bacterium]MDB4801550.1 glycosyltransferase [Akkermansiaceae bacterium]